MTYYNKMLTTIDYRDDSYIIDMSIIDRHIPFKNNNLNTTHNSSFKVHPNHTDVVVEFIAS